jgi:chaperonin GroES
LKAFVSPLNRHQQDSPTAGVQPGAGAWLFRDVAHPGPPGAGRSGVPGRSSTEEEKPMKFRPLHDRVAVRRIESEEKTAGGIIIPDTAKEKPMEGEVLAVGPGARDDKGQLVAPDVKTGDRILFGKWSGTEVVIDGEELLIMKESDILGVIEGGAGAKRKAA